MVMRFACSSLLARRTGFDQRFDAEIVCVVLKCHRVGGPNRDPGNGDYSDSVRRMKSARWETLTLGKMMTS